MKNSMITFILGGAVCSLVTYIYMLKRMEKEVEEVAKDYKFEIERLQNIIKSEDNKPDNNEEKDVPNNDVEAKNKKNYENIAAGYSLNENENFMEEFNENLRRERDKEVSEDSKFEIITAEKFFNEDLDEYEKITLLYYDGNDILLDEMKDIVPHPSLIIGNALLHFGDDPESDPDSVYVRNFSSKVDFEIINMHETYFEHEGEY